MSKQLVSRVALAIAATCVLGEAAHVAHAAPINYVETSFDDLKRYDPADPVYRAPKTLALGTGVNTVTGRVADNRYVEASPGEGIPNDYTQYFNDYFYVTVPAAAQLTGVQVSVSNLQSSFAVYKDSLKLDVEGFNRAVVPLGFTDVGGSTVFLRGGTATATGGPNGPGTYIVNIIGAGPNHGSPLVYSDYVLSLTVAAVPEPTSLLTLTALLATATLTRRRRG